MQMSNDGSQVARKLTIWPEGSDLSAVKAMVMEGGYPFSVKPFWAHQKTDERVLVLEDGYDWGPTTDWIQPRSPQAMQLAIEWCLGLTELHRGPHLAIDTIKSIFGEGTVELQLDPWGKVVENGWDDWPDS